MSQISINHYRGFRSDHRLSMDIYAEAITQLIEGDEFTSNSIRPQSNLERFSDNRLIMRYLRYWHYPQSIKKEHADLHHVLDHGYAHLHSSFNVANPKTKACVSVHDLIPMLTWNGDILSEAESRINTRKPWLNLRSLSYLGNYDRLIAISSSTKNDLVNYLGLEPEKIDVIPPVINSIFQLSEEKLVTEFAEKYGFNRDCKWIMVSGGEYYKNHRTCLKVLAELNRQHDESFCLVKTGLDSHEFNAMVADVSLEPNVKSVFLEDIDELVLLYAMVDCLLFPSLYEGFGMPVAEALACGTPVVTSNRGSLPEVAGTLAETCDAGDVESLSRAVTSMIFDDGRRSGIKHKGPLWVEQFRASVIESKLSRFYKTLLQN